MTERHEEQQGCKTVLVADCDPWAQDPVAGMLRWAGYEIVAANDAVSTRAAIEEHADEIVAVILDSNIPGGSGDEIFEDIQRVRPNIPVIMTSGSAEQDVIGRFLGMGVVAFLMKPFGLHTLVETVQRVLDRPVA